VTILLAILIGVLFAVSVFLMLGHELKGVCMGVFLLGHAANLSLLASSRSPIAGETPLAPPIVPAYADPSVYADPLPQALILTAIVIGFAVQAFLLTLLVVTYRRNRTLELDELAHDPDPGSEGDHDEPNDIYFEPGDPQPVRAVATGAGH